MRSGCKWILALTVCGLIWAHCLTFACLAGMDSPERGYHGVSGPTYFDRNGDSRKALFIKTVRNGAFTAAARQMN